MDFAILNTQTYSIEKDILHGINESDRDEWDNFVLYDEF